MRRRTPCNKCGGGAAGRALARSAGRARTVTPNVMVTVRQELRALLRRFGVSRFSISLERDGTGKVTNIKVKLTQALADNVISFLPSTHQNSPVTYENP